MRAQRERAPKEDPHSSITDAEKWPHQDGFNQSILPWRDLTEGLPTTFGVTWSCHRRKRTSSPNEQPPGTFHSTCYVRMSHGEYPRAEANRQGRSRKRRSSQDPERPHQQCRYHDRDQDPQGSDVQLPGKRFSRRRSTGKRTACDLRAFGSRVVHRRRHVHCGRTFERIHEKLCR